MASAATGDGGAAGAGEPKSTLDLYELVQVIGKGSFGTVSKIRRKTDGRIMVWKELNYGSMREKEKQLVVSEVNILRELKHPFIVRYYDRIIDKAATRLYIVMEFCEGGDLGAIIKNAKKTNQSVDEEFIWKVFAQLLLALKDCHRHKDLSGKAKPILHRDLKPGNIFLDGSQNIKIGDFGLAKELSSQSMFATTNVGTPFYMSPEMISEQKYNEKSDIWALGCLLYEMASLAPPFEAANAVSLAVKINSGRFNRVPQKYSEDLHRAIRWMLQTDFTKRPTVEELEKLPRLKPGLDRAVAYLQSLERARNPTGVAEPNATMGRTLTKDEQLNARESDVTRREAEVSRREANADSWERSLKEKELQAQNRWNELLKREQAVAQMQQQMQSQQLSRPSSSAGMVIQPQQSGPSLHRAHSTNELLQQQHGQAAAMQVPSLRRVTSIPTVAVSISEQQQQRPASYGAAAPTMPSSAPPSRPSSAHSTHSITSMQQQQQQQDAQMQIHHSGPVAPSVGITSSQQQPKASPPASGGCMSPGVSMDATPLSPAQSSAATSDQVAVQMPQPVSRPVLGLHNVNSNNVGMNVAPGQKFHHAYAAMSIADQQQAAQYGRPPSRGGL